MILSNAQVTKHPGKPWDVVTPEGEVLGTFPGELSNRDVVGLMEFSQKYEQAAYKEGVAAGQSSMSAAMSQRADALINHIKQLENHNSILAQKLEDLLTRGAPSNGND